VTVTEIRTREPRPIRVVVAKAGLDGHDRGARVIARALRDAGMEVIYTGIFQTPESIVSTVLEEDAKVVGLSSLSGAHMEYADEILVLLRRHGLEDVLFIVGGTVPADDAEELMARGVSGVFGPGSNTGQVVEFIRSRTSDTDTGKERDEDGGERSGLHGTAR
jgi:methylmalonyl-CoA mutase C-terminal domain/subunit